MLKALKAEWGKVTIDPKIDIFLEKNHNPTLQVKWSFPKIVMYWDILLTSRNLLIDIYQIHKE
jgi:hypothetical protein